CLGVLKQSSPRIPNLSLPNSGLFFLRPESECEDNVLKAPPTSFPQFIVCPVANRVAKKVAVIYELAERNKGELCIPKLRIGRERVGGVALVFMKVLLHKRRNHQKRESTRKETIFKKRMHLGHGKRQQGHGWLEMDIIYVKDTWHEKWNENIDSVSFPRLTLDELPTYLRIERFFAEMILLSPLRNSSLDISHGFLGNGDAEAPRLTSSEITYIRRRRRAATVERHVVVFVVLVKSVEPRPSRAESIFHLMDCPRHLILPPPFRRSAFTRSKGPSNNCPYK
ncbi:hypothetical protein L249_7242, partial [Ophiocordyceps polyrhachis-furcata BCC 54312]